MKLLRWVRALLSLPGPDASHYANRAIDTAANIVEMWDRLDATAEIDKSHVREIWPELAWELDALKHYEKLGREAFEEGR